MKRAIINNNGNTAETLLAQLEAAHNLANDLRLAMQALDVHGKDYQTNPNKEDYDNDVKEYREVSQSVADVDNWLRDCRLNIYSQTD